MQPNLQNQNLQNQPQQPPANVAPAGGNRRRGRLVLAQPAIDHNARTYDIPKECSLPAPLNPRTNQSIDRRMVLRYQRTLQGAIPQPQQGHQYATRYVFNQFPDVLPNEIPDVREPVNPNKGNVAPIPAGHPPPALGPARYGNGVRVGYPVYYPRACQYPAISMPYASRKMLAESCPGTPFDVPGGPYDHSHPVNHTLRIRAAYGALDILIHRTFTQKQAPLTIVDIGGKPNLWDHHPFRESIHCTMPLVDAADVWRNTTVTAPGFTCACRYPQSCGQCTGCDAAILVHSLYYITQDDLCALVNVHYHVAAVVHHFPAREGRLEEMCYKRSTKEIICNDPKRITRGYRHPNADWLTTSNVYTDAQNQIAMSWELVTSYGSHQVYMFTACNPGTASSPHDIMSFDDVSLDARIGLKRLRIPYRDVGFGHIAVSLSPGADEITVDLELLNHAVAELASKPLDTHSLDQAIASVKRVAKTRQMQLKDYAHTLEAIRAFARMIAANHVDNVRDVYAASIVETSRANDLREHGYDAPTFMYAMTATLRGDLDMASVLVRTHPKKTALAVMASASGLYVAHRQYKNRKRSNSLSVLSALASVNFSALSRWCSWKYVEIVESLKDMVTISRRSRIKKPVLLPSIGPSPPLQQFRKLFEFCTNNWNSIPKYRNLNHMVSDLDFTYLFKMMVVRFARMAYWMTAHAVQHFSPILGFWTAAVQFGVYLVTFKPTGFDFLGMLQYLWWLIMKGVELFFLGPILKIVLYLVDIIHASMYGFPSVVDDAPFSLIAAVLNFCQVNHRMLNVIVNLSAPFWEEHVKRWHPSVPVVLAAVEALSINGLTRDAIPQLVFRTAVHTCLTIIPYRAAVALHLLYNVRASWKDITDIAFIKTVSKGLLREDFEPLSVLPPFVRVINSFQLGNAHRRWRRRVFSYAKAFDVTDNFQPLEGNLATVSVCTEDMVHPPMHPEDECSSNPTPDCKSTLGTICWGIAFAGVVPFAHRSCSHNELSAVRTRVTVWPSPTQQDLSQVFCDVPCPDWSSLNIFVNDWLKSLDPVKRKLYLSWIESPQGPDEASKHELFVKIECGLATDPMAKKPRAIQTSTPMANFSTGPIFTQAAKTLERFVNEHPHWHLPYTQNVDDLAKAVNQKLDFEPVAYYSIDGERMDAAIAPSFNKFLQALVASTGHDDGAFEVLVGNATVRGRSRRGIKYQAKHGICSGVQWTSFNHCLFMWCAYNTFEDREANNHLFLNKGDDLWLAVGTGHLDPDDYVDRFRQHLVTLGVTTTCDKSDLLFHSEFLAMRPYRAANGHICFVPKPGRMLAKLGWTSHPSKVWSPQTHAHHLIVGLAHLNKAPIFRGYLQGLTKFACKPIAPKDTINRALPDLEYKAFGSSEQDFNILALNMAELYDVSVDALLDFDKALSSIPHLPYAVPHWIIPAIMAVDMDYDVIQSRSTPVYGRFWQPVAQRLSQWASAMENLLSYKPLSVLSHTISICTHSPVYQCTSENTMTEVNSNVTLSRMPRKARRVVDALLDSRTITPEGLDWLVIATDPFCDEEVTITGYPDIRTARSVRQCVTLTANISVPAGITGTWECAVFLAPFAPDYNVGDQEYIAITNNQGDVTARTYPIKLVSGLNVVAGPTGMNWLTSLTAGSCSYSQALKIPSTYSRGDWRLIAGGFEVSNTTAELYKSGAVTIVRTPGSIIPGWTRQSSIIQDDCPTDYVHIGCSTQADCALFPGSRTWAAKEGVYMPFTLNSQEVPCIANEMSKIQFVPVNTEPPAARAGFGTLPSDASRAHALPYDCSQAWFAGLQNQTTLQVTVKYYLERYPTTAMRDLVVLTQPPCPYDPVALEIYARSLSHLPVGVPVGENPLGEWFSDVLRAVSGIAPVVGGIAGSYFGNPSAGLALGNMAGQGMKMLADTVTNNPQPKGNRKAKPLLTAKVTDSGTVRVVNRKTRRRRRRRQQAQRNPS